MTHQRMARRLVVRLGYAAIRQVEVERMFVVELLHAPLQSRSG